MAHLNDRKRSVSMECSQHKGLEEEMKKARSYRSQWAQLGVLIFIFKNNEKLHLHFERVTLAAAWRTDDGVWWGHWLRMDAHTPQ